MRSSKVICQILAILSLLFIIGLNGCSLTTTDDVETTTTSTTPQIVKDLTAVEAYNLVQANANNPDFIIIDVRTASEYASGHLPNATNINYYSDNFTIEISKLGRDNVYLIYCRTGVRSTLSRDAMKSLGFLNVNNMLGGFTAWMAAGYPIVKD
jgi:rhodanese-related sulfurtransferase